MSATPATRYLLVVGPARPWLPEDGCALGDWTLAVQRVDALEELSSASAPWDVVAFQAGIRPADETLDALRQAAPGATFLPVATDLNSREALYYLKHGSFEYLEEPLTAPEFLRALAGAVENRDTFLAVLDLNKTLEAQTQQLLKEKAELERMNGELEAVSRLARSLASTLEPEEILFHLSHSILATVSCGRVLAATIDYSVPCEQTRVHFTVADDGTPRQESAAELCWLLDDPSHAPWKGTVLRDGQPLCVRHPRTDARTADTPLAGVHCFPFVKLPLRTRGQVVGTVSVESRRADQELGAEELELLGIFADSTAMALENAHLYHAMRELSVRDELTGLYNRRYLMEQFNAEWQDAERRGNALSVLLADVDFFKLMNDGNDHLVGDAALRTLATTLLRNTRGVDTVARFGGEEFVVLLPRTDAETALRVAEKLRSLVEKTSFPGAAVLPGGKLTISIGVAARLPDDTEPKQLLERADWALYRAKHGGRNQVRVWQTEPSKRAAAS